MTERGLIIIIAFMIIMFAGDPDLHDALIHNIMETKNE